MAHMCAQDVLFERLRQKDRELYVLSSPIGLCPIMEVLNYYSWVYSFIRFNHESIQLCTHRIIHLWSYSFTTLWICIDSFL